MKGNASAFIRLRRIQALRDLNQMEPGRLKKEAYENEEAELLAVQRKEITVKELYEQLGSDVTDYHSDSVK